MHVGRESIPAGESRGLGHHVGAGFKPAPTNLPNNMGVIPARFVETELGKLTLRASGTQH